MKAYGYPAVGGGKGFTLSPGRFTPGEGGPGTPFWEVKVN